MNTLTRIRNGAITPLRGAAAAAVVTLAILAGGLMAQTATSEASRTTPVAVSALDLVAEAMAKNQSLPVDDSGTRGFLVFSPPTADGH